LIAQASKVGTTYGLAWARSTRLLYASSYFKKHAGFGPGGPGAIYVVNPATNAVVNTFTVPNATTNGHDTANYFTDNGNTAWDSVDKTSLGAMTLSPDEATLYVMNLEDRKLYALNASTGVVSSTATPTGLPQPPGTDAATTCGAVNTRPFAVTVYGGVGYAGLTCTGPTVADLRGYVYTFDLATLAFSPAPVFSNTLNYPRGMASIAPGVPNSTRPAAWNPWASVFTAIPPSFADPSGAGVYPAYPQPILANIAFDQGNMILGIRDRFGDQMGNRAPDDPANPNNLYFGIAAGDTLRACGNPAAGWTLESNARCGGAGAGPQNNGQGPGGGEFYYQDDFQPYHDEVSLGAVAQIPGYPDVLAATYNPARVNGVLFPDATFDGGVRWFNNATGGYTKGYRVFNGNNNSDPATINVFGKAAGLGEIVVLCDAAPIELGNRVWQDTNGNGRQDPGELGINGVVVGLYDVNGTLLVTTTTSGDGNYYFTATNPSGTQLIQPHTGYQIRIDNTVPQVPLNNLKLTLTNSAASGSDSSNDPISDVRDSDAILLSPTIAQIIYTTGGAGATNHGLDFGYTGIPPAPKVNLGNQVWIDTNDNGMIDTGEVGVPSVTVELYQDTDGSGGFSPGDTLIGSTTTGPGGYYTFTNLTPSSGITTNYLVVITGTNFVGTGPLAGYRSSTPITAPSTNLADDNKNHGVTLPALGVVASGPIPLTAGAQPFTTTVPGDSNWTIDFGFFKPQPVVKVNLGNQVWFDTNDNGMIDAGEVGVPGVTVELYQDTDGSGGFSPGDTLIGSTTTGPGGYYTFTNLTPSSGITTNYLVVITGTNFVGTGPLAGHRPSDLSIPPSTSAADDSKNHGVALPALGVVASGPIPLTAGTQPFTTTVSGDSNWTIDFGFYSLSLGNQVWNDANNNGVIDAGETGIPGVKVDLLNGANVIVSSTTTGPGGYYTFTNLISGTYRVQVTAPAGFVSSSDITTTASPDNNVDNDDNGIGGAGGVISSNPVTLIPGSLGAANNNSVNNATGTTLNPTVDFGLHQLAALGDYVWIDRNKNGVQDESPSDGLNGVTVTLYQNGVALSTTTTANDASGNPGYYLFDNLNPGTYSVTFGLPAGYTFTTPNLGGDAAKDSDANPATGATGNYTLGAGERNLTVDAGLVPIPTQPQLAGLGDFVWADLNKNGLQDANEPGIPGVTVTLYNQAGTVLSTTQTNASGYYSFTGLPPGTYQVGFTLPPGYTFTQQHVGSNPQIDSDADVTTGRTQTVTLQAGDYNPTLDAGVIVPLAQLGDFVWKDINKNGIQDSGEPGIPGVTVTLRTPGGTLISTTVTDSQGKYLFPNLQPGSYVVCFALPPGYVFSPPNQGSDRGADSNADTTTGCAIAVTLAPGESNLTIDAGMYQPAGTPLLTLNKTSKTSNGTNQVFTGDIITYTLVVSNGGTAPASGVVVTDSVPTATQYVAGSASPVPASGPNPFVWNIGTLGAGESKTVLFAVKVITVSNTASIKNVAITSGAGLTPTQSPEVVNPGAVTAVTLSAFNATVSDSGPGVKVSWRTEVENNTFGFDVLRSTTGNLADAVKVNKLLVVAQGASAYTVQDDGGALNNTYWLKETELDGNTRNYGPVTAMAQVPPTQSPIASPSPQQTTNPNPTQPTPSTQLSPLQPSPLPTGQLGGVPLGMNGGTSGTAGTTAGAAQVAAQPASPATNPQILAAQPAVILTAPEVKTATSAATTAATASSQTQPATASNLPAQSAQTALSTGTRAAPDAVADGSAPKAEAVGASGAVAVARGGGAAEARLATQTQRVMAPRAHPASPLPGLLGALALMLSGLGASGVFIVRRRRCRGERA